MTFEKPHSSKSKLCGQHRTPHSSRTVQKSKLCGRNYLSLLSFLTKLHNCTVKEGGQLQKQKGGKMAEKEGKREKNVFYRENGKQLCGVRFALSGALP